MDIEEKLIRGNKLFVDLLNDNHQKQEITKNLVSGQKPYALIITCSDSRVSPEIMFSTYLGELFVIRTAGNVINEGELATVEYAIEHLGIQYILVLGHTHCGAVHAAIKNEHGKYIDVILNRIRHSISDEVDEYQASIKNAKEEVRFIKECFPNYKGQVKPAIYNIETNEVKII